jgi:hypothetical protein
MAGKNTTINQAAVAAAGWEQRQRNRERRIAKVTADKTDPRFLIAGCAI